MRTSCSNFLGLTTSSRAARVAWRSRYSWWRTSFLQGTAAGTAGVRQHTKDMCPDVSGTQAQASDLISSAPQPLHQQRVLLAETQEKATAVLSLCLVAYVQPGLPGANARDVTVIPAKAPFCTPPQHTQENAPVPHAHLFLRSSANQPFHALSTFLNSSHLAWKAVRISRCLSRRAVITCRPANHPGDNRM